MAILRTIIMPGISPLQGFLIVRVMQTTGGGGRLLPEKHNAAQAEYDRLAALV
jgi:hypothetical protein